MKKVEKVVNNEAWTYACMPARDDGSFYNWSKALIKADLNDDMSISFTHMDYPDMKNVNEWRMHQIAYGCSSSAKLELLEADTNKIIIRCRTARLDTVNKRGASIYQVMRCDDTGTLTLKNPYNPANDRYLLVDLKDKKMVVAKKKKDDWDVTECLDVSKASKQKYAEFIHTSLLKRMNAIIFMDKDFYKPIEDMCKNNKQYNYLLDIAKDPIYLKSFNELDLRRNGVFIGPSVQDLIKSPDFKERMCKANVVSQYYATYDNSDIERQLAGTLFMVMNNGLESYYKSLYRPNLINKIYCGKVFVDTSISKLNDTDKAGQKIINETYKLLTDPEIYMASGKKIAKDSEINTDIVRKLSGHQSLLVNFADKLNGFNNYMSFMHTYFSEYWYYEFLIQSEHAKEKTPSYLSSPEKIFSRTVSYLLEQFFDDIYYLHAILEDCPNYTNNISGFANYFICGCRKQGFTQISSMARLLRDYISMQKSLGGTAEKYPANLHLVHDIANVNTILKKESEEHDSAKFNESVNKYRSLEYRKGDYAIIVPERFTDLFIEGASLNHCVANYISKVIDNSCKILFLRKKDDIQTPFYTIDIERKDVIIQVKGINQKDPDTDDLKTFIDEWAQDKGLFQHYI